MSSKEATARIKINRLLEAAEWQFFPEGDRSANIRLETTIAIKTIDLDVISSVCGKNKPVSEDVWT